jgi:ribonucleoside-diphosphate reductase alpha chain
VPFEESKISVAITKAFLAVEGGTAAASSRIHETVAKLTEQVTATFRAACPRAAPCTSRISRTRSSWR